MYVSIGPPRNSGDGRRGCAQSRGAADGVASRCPVDAGPRRRAAQVLITYLGREIPIISCSQ